MSEDSELTHRVKSPERQEQAPAETTVVANPVVSASSVLLKIFISLLAVSILVIFLIPSPISPSSRSISAPPHNLDGSITSTVRSSQKIRLPGCESFAIYTQGFLYTGTYNGLVVQISPDFRDVTPLVRTGTEPVDSERCNSSSLEDDLTDCGKVLGVRLLNEDTLVVIDSIYGIYSVSIKRKSKSLLLDLRNQPSYLDKPINLPNSLVVLPANNSFLFTDSTTKFPPSQVLLALLEHGQDGRVYRYDLSTGDVTLLVSNLHFPNGIELHRDEQSVLIAEFSISRITRYFFAGSKRGRREMFADNLIGLPDNIQRARGTGYWVGIPLIRDSFFDVMLKYPIIGITLTKLISVETLQRQSVSSEGKDGLAVRLSEEGEVVEYVHDPSGKHTALVTETGDSDNGYIHFASFSAEYIVRAQYPIQ